MRENLSSGTAVSIGTVWSTSASTNTISISASTGTVTTANAISYMVCDGRGVCVTQTAVASAPPRPSLTISCDEESCSVRGHGDMANAEAMLEKIANRSVRVEVSVDQACHVQRKTIERKQDLVADAR